MNEYFLSPASMGDNQLDWIASQVAGEVFWPYHFANCIKGAWAGLIPGNYRPYLYIRKDATIASRRRTSDLWQSRVFWGQWFAASQSVLNALPPDEGQSAMLKEFLHQAETAQFVDWSSDWRDCKFSDALCVPAANLLDFPELPYHRDKVVHIWETLEDFQRASASGAVIVPPPMHKVVGYYLCRINFRYREMKSPVPVPMVEPI